MGIIDEKGRNEPKPKREREKEKKIYTHGNYYQIQLGWILESVRRMINGVPHWA
jgi:hypothetical protein